MPLGFFKRKKKNTVGVLAQVAYIIAWVKWVAEMAHWIADSLSNMPPMPVHPGKVIVTDEGEIPNNSDTD